MKTRGGWRETNRIEHSGRTSLEVRQLDATRLSEATLEELMAARTPALDREGEGLADRASAPGRKVN